MACPISKTPSGIHSNISDTVSPLPRKWTSWGIFSLFLLPVWGVGASSGEMLHLHTLQGQDSPPLVRPPSIPLLTTHGRAQLTTIYLPRSSSASSSPRHVILSSAPKRHTVFWGKILKAFPLTGFSSLFFKILFLFPFTFWRSLINNSELHAERTCKAQLWAQKGAISMNRGWQILLVLLHTAWEAVQARQ